jgi:hypothetical protein
LRQRVKIFGDIFRKPFDDHFRDCLEGFRKRKRLFEEELQIAGIGETMARYEELGDQMASVQKLSVSVLEGESGTVD